MSHQVAAVYEDSISNALGVLYQRKELSNTLIRVLEDYRRVCGPASNRAWKPASCDSGPQSKNRLEWLYLRRAAVDEAIRSIEAYSGTAVSSHSHR